MIPLIVAGFVVTGFLFLNAVLSFVGGYGHATSWLRLQAALLAVLAFLWVIKVAFLLGLR